MFKVIQLGRGSPRFNGLSSTGRGRRKGFKQQEIEKRKKKKAKENQKNTKRKTDLG